MQAVFYKTLCFTSLVASVGLLGCQREHIDQSDEPRTSIMSQLSAPLIPYNMERDASELPRLKGEGTTKFETASVASQH